MVVWNGITKQMKEYCKKGDLIGVKGRLEMRDGKAIVVGEKITLDVEAIKAWSEIDF